MKNVLTLFLCLAVALIATVAVGADCSNCPQKDSCSAAIEVPAIVIVEGQSVATVGRSVGIVRETVRVSRTVVSKMIKTKPVRTTVTVAARIKPARRVVQGVRLVCPPYRGAAGCDQ